MNESLKAVLIWVGLIVFVMVYFHIKGRRKSDD